MKTKNIEAEIRSFITPKQHKKLLRFFKKEGRYLGKENQTTYYFSGQDDLRIQRSGKSAKIWLKKGKMHDDLREEIEVQILPEQFESANKVFEFLGYKIKIKWLRERHSFIWKSVQVMLDNTKGYGHIIELEKMCQESEKEKTVAGLRKKLNSLGIKETDKKYFDKKFRHYKNDWKKLIG